MGETQRWVDLRGSLAEMAGPKFSEGQVSKYKLENNRICPIDF